MTFDLKKIEPSKKAYRLKLAALPFAEKLRILDRMRDRDLALRNANPVEKDRWPAVGSGGIVGS